MKNILTSKDNARVHPNNIVVKNHNSATYWDKSLMTLVPKIWNALPEKIKSQTSLLPIRAAEIVECMRKYMDGSSQNLQSLSSY